MFGSAKRSYTAIGPSVSYCRTATTSYRTRILVSAAVADYLEEDEIIKCSPLELKGVDETVLTFQSNQR